jgi:hypothetical protein
MVDIAGSTIRIAQFPVLHKYYLLKVVNMKANITSEKQRYCRKNKANIKFASVSSFFT